MDNRKTDIIAAMAIAAIAEELEIEVRKVRILSFQEIDDDIQED